MYISHSTEVILNICSANIFRFVPDKEFSGTDRNQVRDGPVQFEKAVEEDPFELNQFLTEARKGKRTSDR